MSVSDTVRTATVKEWRYCSSNRSLTVAVQLGLVALFFLAFFGAVLLKLVERWSKDPSYSHGPLVPFISLWLAIRAYRRVGPPVGGEVGVGCLAMAAGAMLHLLLTVLNNPVLEFVAAGLILWGVAAAVGGVAWAQGFLFPIGFLFFMFPLPATWTNFAGLWLQDWVGQVSAALIDPFVVCYRRGNSLYLAGVPGPLVVAAECSGLRQIVSFAALGVLVGGLSRKAWTFRVLLAAAAIPAALLTNVVRILLMAAGSVWFGTQWIGTWMHDVPALVTLPLGTTLFLMIVWGLNRLTAESLPFRARSVDDGLAPNPLLALPAWNRSDSEIRGLRAAVACLIGGLLAEGGLTWYLHAGEAPAYPDLCAPLAELPHVLPSPAQVWQGQDLPNLEEFRAKLPYHADDLLYRLYKATPAGPSVYLYMVYSRQGDDRKHHPEICIRDASGATEDFAARRQIALDAEGRRSVMRFRFRTGISQFTTVYYWHYSLEAPPRQGQTILRRLYQQQNYPVPSITVQVALVGEEKEALEQGFLAAVDSALRRSQLPATARIGCDRLPIALVREQ
jgi:exosortase